MQLDLESLPAVEVTANSLPGFLLDQSVRQSQDGGEARRRLVRLAENAETHEALLAGHHVSLALVENRAAQESMRRILSVRLAEGAADILKNWPEDATWPPWKAANKRLVERTELI